MQDDYTDHTGPATGPTILIIDDDASLRQTMAEALQNEGYQAVAVEPTAGLDAARTLALP